MDASAYESVWNGTIGRQTGASLNPWPDDGSPGGSSLVNPVRDGGRWVRPSGAGRG